EQIQELEVQMEGLKFENSNLANQLEEEREKNKFIKENKIFKLVQLTTQIFYNNLLFFRICSYLSPEDLVSLSKQMPDQICPIQMTVKQYCRLRFDKTCQFCSQPNNNCTILELKIRICRQCRELELTSRLNLEESSYPSELIPALHSVDYEQLNGNYLDNSV
ncbi:8306_t:CDS:2, partial [Gigaspora rosea]